MRSTTQRLNTLGFKTILVTAGIILAHEGTAQASWGNLFSWLFGSPDNGFGIELDFNKTNYRTGEAALVSGRIRYKSAHSSGWTSLPHNILNNVEIRAMYPDALTPIPISVNRSSGTFTLNLSNLQPENLNRLTVTIGKEVPAHVRRLEQLESKIRFLVLILDRKIADLERRRHASAAQIAALKAERDRLLGVAVKVDDLVSQEGSLIATRSQGVLVDNQDVADGEYSTLLAGFRHTMTSSPSVLVQGQNVTIKGKIQNLRARLGSTVWSYPCYRGDKWLVKLYKNGALLRTIGPVRLDDTGEFVTFEETLAGLRYQDDNRFKAELYRVERTNHRGEITQTREYGELELDLPVARDQVAPIWLAGFTPSVSHVYVQTAEPLSLVVADAFGRLDRSHLDVRLTAQSWGGMISTGSILSSLIISSSDDDRSLQVQGELNPLPEGKYTVTARAQDRSLNYSVPNPLTVDFQIDRTKPVISLQMSEPSLTKNPNVSITATIVDRSPVGTTVRLNDEQVGFYTDGVFVLTLTLSPGINRIELLSKDLAGNESEPVALLVTLDTAAPILTAVQPVNGTIFSQSEVQIQGRSNEQLSSALLNGQALTLASDGTSFSGVYALPSEGTHVLTLQAFDLVGNRTQSQIEVSLSLGALNRSLVSVETGLVSGKLYIIGKERAATPGASIGASAGLLNFASTTADSTGRFILELSAFSNATLTATTADGSRTDTIELTFNLETRLSGAVRDPDGRPIPGVRVSIANNGNTTTTTNAQGAFEFINPPSGDQKVRFDATNATDPCVSCGVRNFGSETVAVSIGYLQSNVLSRPIYIVPQVASEAVAVRPGEAISIASTADPTFTLNLTNSANVHFPTGSGEGHIYLGVLHADANGIVPTTAPLPEQLSPKKVYVLEPSGTTFAEPQEITLANDNELPVGSDVLILSSNTLSGEWEIGAVASVESAGTIRSKPGKGITHFSQIFAVPYGPLLSQIGSKGARVGSFDGSLKVDVGLPAYRILETDIAQRLIYRSNWAKPDFFITTLFSLEDPTTGPAVQRSGQDQNWTIDRSRYQDLGCHQDWFLDSCRAQWREWYTSWTWNELSQTTSWYQPRSITAHVRTAQRDLPPARKDITDENPLLTRTLFSFHSSLLDEDTNQYPDTGVYRYTANYEIALKGLTVRTWSRRNDQYETSCFRRNTQQYGGYSKCELRRDPIQTTYSSGKETSREIISEILGRDLDGIYFVQNKTESAFGNGWRMAGTQQILNPTESLLAIEEGDGEIATYVIDNSIATVFNGNGTPWSLRAGTDLSRWPNATISTNATDDCSNQGMFRVCGVFGQNRFADINLTIPSSYETATVHTVPNYQAMIYHWANNYGGHYHSNLRAHDFGSFLRMPNGDTIITDRKGQILRHSASDGTTVALNSVFKNITQQFLDGETESFGSSTTIENFCLSQLGIECPPETQEIDFRGNLGILTRCSSGSCNHAAYPSSSSLPNPGYAEGLFADALFNSPSAMIIDSGQSVLVADTGNHRVRRLLLSDGRTELVAGNGQTNDEGNGVLATEASIFHPIALAKDSIGRVYVATERGLIRRINTSGVIENFAGHNPKGGNPSRFPSSDLLLHSPGGLAYDEIRDAIYVSDKSGNRVYRIDLATSMVDVVAGSGLPCTPGLGSDPNRVRDGNSALAANLCNPTELGFDTQGNLLIADSGNSRIRKVTFTNDPSGILSFSPAMHDGSRLVRQTNGTWTRTSRSGATIRYDASGRSTELKDSIGRATQHVYDTGGNLIRIVDPLGGATEVSYSGGRVSSITGPDGKVTDLQFNGNELSQVIFPDPGNGSDRPVRSFSYTDGRLSTETDQNGGRRAYSYNSLGRLKGIKENNTDETIIEDIGSKTIVGSSATDTIQGAIGNGDVSVTNEIRTAEGAVFYNIDFKGLITQIRVDDGRKTQFSYDDDGRILAVRRLDSNGSILNTKAFTYDEFGSLLRRTDSETDVDERYTYDAFGRMSSHTNSLNKTTTFDRNPTTGLITRVRRPLGEDLIISYFPVSGVLATVQDVALGSTVSYSYDSKWNLATSGAGSTSYSRNISGAVDSAGFSGANTSYVRDALGRIVQATAADGTSESRTVLYSYFSNGVLESFTDPYGNRTNFTIDEYGRPFEKRGPHGSYSSVSYDSRTGKVKTIRPGLLSSVSRGYDLSGRLALINDAQFTYDTFGRLSVARNQNAEVTLGYDPAGRIARRTTRWLGPDGGLVSDIQYEYNALGQRTAQIDQTGTTIYNYDDLGRLIRIQNPAAEVFEFDYFAGQRLRTIRRPGTITEFGMDSEKRLSSIRHLKGGAEVSSRTYSYNSNQTIATIVGSNGGTTLTYDSHLQLTSYQNPDLQGSDPRSVESFAYDKLGGRDTVDGVAQTYHLNSGSRSDRLSTDGTFQYTYGPSGHLIIKSYLTNPNDLWSFTYDALGSLVQVDRAQNDTLLLRTHYKYGPFGERIEKKVINYTGGEYQGILPGNTIQRYAYDGSDLLLIFDGSNRLAARYTNSTIFQDDAMAIRIFETASNADISDTPGSVMFLKDNVGSVIVETTSTGTVIHRNVFSAFGKVIEVQDANGIPQGTRPSLRQPVLFAGRQFDRESGLYYMRSRSYDPNSGRFQTRDALADSVYMGQSAYNYAANNPLLLGDPSGMWVGYVSFGASFLTPMTAIVPFQGQAGIVAGWDNGNFMETFNIGLFVSPGVGYGFNIGAGINGGISNSDFSGVAGDSFGISAAVPPGGVSVALSGAPDDMRWDVSIGPAARAGLSINRNYTALVPLFPITPMRSYCDASCSSTYYTPSTLPNSSPRDPFQMSGGGANVSTAVTMGPAMPLVIMPTGGGVGITINIPIGF